MARRPGLRPYPWILFLVFVMATNCLTTAAEPPKTSAESSAESSVPQVPPSPSAQETFSKRSGDIPDQLAVESSPVEHRGRPIPVPVSVPSYPGSMVLPVPPGFRGMGGGQGQHHSQGHSYAHTHQNGDPPFRIQKGKEIYATPIPIGQSPAQIHNANTQLHNNIRQQNVQKIHPNHKPGNSEGKIMSKPVQPDTFKHVIPVPSDQHRPEDAHLANTLFQNLFEKQRLKKQRPTADQSAPDLNPAAGAHHPEVQYGGVLGPNPLGPWNAQDGDMPKITSLEVKCEKNVMRVYIAFDRPFHGVIFSKGHYHNVNCIHLPAGLGHTSANFDISIDSCGTQGNTENGLYGHGSQTGSGSYFENIIVIQYDSQVQEVWDQARKLRCTWHDQYEKSVTFRPFPVDMLDVVRADFAGDNVGCWMQIQVGKGPWASEVSGLVKIGQTMTMVLAIKDDDNKFDMLVRNCMAHDGVRAPIQLVDQFGCVTRPKLMSRFTKIKNFGQSASVLSYAHFQAFKFPDSMEVHFQCTIQICRFQCPEQCVKDGHERLESRRKRSVDNGTDVGVQKIISVVTTEDIEYVNSGSSEITIVNAQEYIGDVVCMSTFGFVAMLIVLIGTLLISVVVSGVVVLRRRMRRDLK